MASIGVDAEGKSLESVARPLAFVKGPATVPGPKRPGSGGASRLDDTGVSGPEDGGAAR